MITAFMITDYAGKHITNLQENTETKITELGLRKVLSQNFSKLVTLPKDALIDNRTGQEAKRVSVQLVEEKGAKYLKLTPIFETDLL